MAQERIYHPAPSNLGEPQSVRDAYDAQLAEQAQSETGSSR